MLFKFNACVNRHEVASNLQIFPVKEQLKRDSIYVHAIELIKIEIEIDWTLVDL
jgi:hypothetical protein